MAENLDTAEQATKAKPDHRDLLRAYRIAKARYELAVYTSEDEASNEAELDDLSEIHDALLRNLIAGESPNLAHLSTKLDIFVDEDLVSHTNADVLVMHLAADARRLARST
ncbi:MAG: hypothetical protein KDE55_19095 [Novosphingobium sp.]|nr:hypothetical protein [Novosphingobium sp.]